MKQVLKCDDCDLFRRGESKCGYIFEVVDGGAVCVLEMDLIIAESLVKLRSGWVAERDVLLNKKGKV